MLLDLARLLLVIVFVTIVLGVDEGDGKHKQGSRTTKITHSRENRRTNQTLHFRRTTSNIRRKRLGKLKTRGARGIEFGNLGIGRAAPLGFNPLAVPYGARLAPLGFQPTPALQQLAQYRGVVPAVGGLIPSAAAAALRFPYGLLPALGLYRNLNRVQLPENGEGGLATDVHVYKEPNRLKYDSIPLKPGYEQQELVGNPLNIPALLQLNSAGDEVPTEDPDEAEADLDELSMSFYPFSKL